MLVGRVVEPLAGRIKATDATADAAREKLDALTRLLKQAGAITSEYQQEVAGHIGSASQEGATTAAFLQELEALSRSADVQLDLKPRPVKPETQMNRLEVELNLEGSQEHVLAFLDGIFQMPRLLTIERLRLSANPMKGDVLRAHLLLHDLTLMSR